MTASPLSLCGVRSNCHVCRSNEAHRRAVGWPDVCPRGVTAESVDQTAIARPSKSAPRRTWQEAATCADLGAVVDWQPCCGGKRPRNIDCRVHGRMPAATCFRCDSFASRPASVV